MRRNPPTDRQLGPIALALSILATVAMPALLPAQEPARKAVPPDVPAKIDPIVEQLVEAHNKERAREKLPPLKLDPKLAEASSLHARDMAVYDKMSHEGSDGSTPEQRVVNTGYHYLRTGENVAVGYKDVAAVLEGWMDSPGHRKNILGDFTEIGAARVLGKDDKPYWCVNFATPMPKFDPANAAKDLIRRINDEREATKLPALDLDEKLAKAAQEQAASLAKKKSDGGGTATFEGVDRALYADLAATTANGHPDAQAMVKVLLGKSDLKDQVLGKFSRIGAGYATSEDGIPYWCLILANPARPQIKRSNR